MLSSAPVALRCTRISFDFAKRINGPSAPERAILALFSSCVARFVIQPTALHCTSTLGDIIWRIRGASPPRETIKTLFSAISGQRWGRAMELRRCIPFTARLPNAALAALWTSISELWSRKRMGSRVSRSTSRTSAGETLEIASARTNASHPPLSVISANVKLALRCRSTLSE